MNNLSIQSCLTLSIQMPHENEPNAFIKESYFHEDNRLTARTDWFLICHAILFEAFLSDTARENQLMAAVVGLLGLYLAVMWLLVGIRAKWVADQLGALLGNEDISGKHLASTVNAIYEARRSATLAWARPLPLFSICAPFATALAWAVLLLGATCWYYWPLIGAGAIASYFATRRYLIKAEDPLPERMREATQHVASAIRTQVNDDK